MKRIFAVIALCAMMLVSAINADAQRLGVTAGANFTSMQNIDQSSATGYSKA